MLVPVLDTNRNPLMPVKPALARLLLTQKKASAYWNKLGIFCIILHKVVDNPSLQQLVVGIDPGSKWEGWSVVGTQDTILNGMSEAVPMSKMPWKSEETCVEPEGIGNFGEERPGSIIDSEIRKHCLHQRWLGGRPNSGS